MQLHSIGQGTTLWTQFQKCEPTNWWAPEVLAGFILSIRAPKVGSGSRSQGQRVLARAAPSPVSLPSTGGSRGAREENVPAEWKQETHSLCSHSAKNWSSSSHLPVLSRRWVFISCDRWPYSLVQSENDCTQDAPVGSFQPLSGPEMVGGHQPALHALLTAGLSAPSHQWATFTSVDGLGMAFRTLQHTSSDSAPSFLIPYVTPLPFNEMLWSTVELTTCEAIRYQS